MPTRIGKEAALSRSNSKLTGDLLRYSASELSPFCAFRSFPYDKASTKALIAHELLLMRCLPLPVRVLGRLFFWGATQHHQSDYNCEFRGENS